MPLIVPGDLQKGPSLPISQAFGFKRSCQAFFFMTSATMRTTTATAMRMMLYFPMIGSLICWLSHETRILPHLGHCRS